VMLDRGDGNAALRRLSAAHRPVVRLRSARREVHFGRFHAKDRRDRIARVLQGERRAPPEHMQRIGVAEVLPEIGKHRLQRLAAQWRGGGVVEIDHLHSSLTICPAMISPMTEGTKETEPTVSACTGMGGSSDQTTGRCSTPRFLSSLRMTRARGSVRVSDRSETRKRVGSSLLPAPIAEMTGTFA